MPATMRSNCAFVTARTHCLSVAPGGAGTGFAGTFAPWSAHSPLTYITGVSGPSVPAAARAPAGLDGPSFVAPAGAAFFLAPGAGAVWARAREDSSKPKASRLNILDDITVLLSFRSP